MIENIKNFVPENAINHLALLLKEQSFILKIVKERKTKRGDFRSTTPLPTITINHNLSQEQFLITLVHEIAHLHTFNKHPNVKAHGKEWKDCFKNLMLPFLNPTIFNEELLRALAKHFINPKATTDADPKLARLLSKTDQEITDDIFFIFDLAIGSIFELNKRIFKILNKRRTRVECLEIKSNKHYLISGNASVKLIKN